jgi:hypothetical protein
MNKKIIQLFALLIVFFLCAAPQFQFDKRLPKNDAPQIEVKEKLTIEFSNPTEFLMVYKLFSLDHDIPEYEGWPVERTTGELKPKESRKTENDYAPGRYIVLWTDKDRYQDNLLVIMPEATYIKLSPPKVFFTPIEEGECDGCI